MRIFTLCVVFGFLFGCNSTSKTIEDVDPQTELNIHKPPVKEMFTIFHAADDSEEVYISGVGPKKLNGFSFLPGECILLTDYDFATLTVHVGTGALDIVNWEGEENPETGIAALLLRGFGYSHIVCGAYEEITCSPQNYLIKNQGSWYNDNYVMKPQKSQYKDLSKCVPIDDKVKK